MKTTTNVEVGFLGSVFDFYFRLYISAYQSSQKNP